MPTHLPPEIQNTLAGFWCYGQNGMTPEILAHLMDDTLPEETVRDWTELVRYIPPGMLRPSEPPAVDWHARLAAYCEKNHSRCRYALTWLVQHHLSAGQNSQAAGWLSDFDYLYRRLQTGSRQARQLWQEIQQLPQGERPQQWESFWRGRQFLVDPSSTPDPNPEPHLTFLALADAYAEGSDISSQAAAWLERIGPDKHWLRLRFRPAQAYAEPMLLELPEEHLRARELDHEWISQILFSPDGRRLLTVTSAGRAHAWEVHSGRDLGPLEHPPASYQWLEEGLLALSKSDLCLLDARTFEVIEQQRLPGDKPWGRRFAAAGSRLVTSNGDRQVLVWDWRERRALSILPPCERGLLDLHFSQDGRRLTIFSESEAHGCDLDESGHPQRYHRTLLRPWSEDWAAGRVQVRDRRLQFANGQAVLSQQVEEIWEWACEGDWALLWEHGSWTLWNLAEARPVAQFGWPAPDEKVFRDGRERYVLRHTKEVLGRSECVRLDDRRQRALSWKLGASSAQILDLTDGQVIATLAGQRDALVNGCLSGDGRRAATVTKQGNLRIWDTHDGKCLRLLKGRAVCAALSPDGSLALSGDAEGQVRLWNLSRGHCLAILEGHSGPIQWLAFGGDGYFLSGDSESFQIWGADRQCRARVARPPQLYPREVSPCGRFLYAEKLGNERWGAALIYDLNQGRIHTTLPCASSKPAAACFTPDSSLLAVANQEGEFFQSCSLRLWQEDHKIESYRLPLPYITVAINPTHLAASSKGNRVSIWERGHPTAPGHEAAVLCMDQEKGRLITGSIDKSAMIWDLESGRCLRRLAGGDRWLQTVVLRGPFALTATDLHNQLWDLEREQVGNALYWPAAVSSQGEVLSLEADHLVLWSPRNPKSKPVKLGPHAPTIHRCAFSPDGTRAVSASALGSVKLWDLSSRRCLKNWETPLASIDSLEWVEQHLLLLRTGDGRGWSWDLEHGTGARLAAESEQAGQVRLEFGTTWQGKPLQVGGRHHQLASWWAPIQQALAQPSGRIVAAQNTGEVLFLELLPPGPTGPRAPLKAPADRKAVRNRRSGLQRTPLERLNACQRLLLVASGGRSDLVAAVPLAKTLSEQGKAVFLAAPLSGRKPSERYREVPPKGKNFENRLAELLQLPLYAFAPEGTLPRLEVYRDLVRHLSVDGLVLVEAGVETLLRGDEPSLGTAADDLVSLAAARQLELPVKMLVNLGLGFDLSKGLCHAYSLEAVAELSQSGGFWGSLSLLPGQPEFALLQEAAGFLAPGHPVQLLVRGLSGEFGGEAYLNPLMNQYWFFELNQVAARCRLLEWLEEKITALDVHRALTNYLTVQPLRPWIEIPC